MRTGRSTLVFEHRPRILSSAAVTGPKEGRGPLGRDFDLVLDDPAFGEKSFEQAERKMFQTACETCLKKAKKPAEKVQALLGGDLENQIMAASLSARALEIPFLGLYGACSTMAESLILGSILTDGGFADPVLCAAGSHYATAERQYRFPLEYGNQRTPAAQWTVTGAGACLLSRTGRGLARAVSACVGRVVDLGISDVNNMGAAMAPAAADTLLRFFSDTGTVPRDYDRVISGDLGGVGSHLLKEMMRKEGQPLTDEMYLDCGLCVFDGRDDVHAGASGCGCSAAVLSALILPKLRSGEWKRVLFMATGALLSPTSAQQGETIPGVAHVICLEGE